MTVRHQCGTCGTTAAHNRDGCCGSCKRYFIGLAAFDAHWRGGPNKRHCIDPATAYRMKQNEDGTKRRVPAFEQVEISGGKGWRLYTEQVNPWDTRDAGGPSRSLPA